MSASTHIQWTDVTGQHHCRRWRRLVVPKNLARLQKLLRGRPEPQLLFWRQWPALFVASMTDIFGEWIPQQMMFAFLDAMRAAPLQTFQMLTKRDLVALRVISRWLASRGLASLPRHMWIGVSVENQELANERIPSLLKIPAKVRFLSCEPLLGPVDLGWASRPKSEGEWLNQIECGQKIDWMIVGGESGPHARPCNLQWIADLVAQCQSANIGAFVKQLGSYPVCDNANLFDFPDDVILQAHGAGAAECRLITTDKKGGDPAEWPGQLRARQMAAQIL